MPFSPDRRVSFLPENRRRNKERFGADLAQGVYSDMKSPHHRSTRILGRANVSGLSTLGHSSDRVCERGGKSLCDTGSGPAIRRKTDLLLCLLIQTGKPRPTKVDSLACPLCEKDRVMYVAQKLSSLSPTVGKETSRGQGPVLVRQVRLEGLVR